MGDPCRRTVSRTAAVVQCEFSCLGPIFNAVASFSLACQRLLALFATQCSNRARCACEDVVPVA